MWNGEQENIFNTVPGFKDISMLCSFFPIDCTFFFSAIHSFVFYLFILFYFERINDQSMSWTATLLCDISVIYSTITPNTHHSIAKNFARRIELLCLINWNACKWNERYCYHAVSMLLCQTMSRVRTRLTQIRKYITAFISSCWSAYL